MQEFQVKLELDGPVATLSMQGDLTHASESRIQVAYEKATRAKAKYIFFDFQKVVYINSAGMSVIISLLNRAQAAEQELRAYGLSPHFQKIFEMVGLLKYIPHFENAEAAHRGIRHRSH